MTTPESVKVRWVPFWRGRPGHLDCPCGDAPPSIYADGQAVICECGRKYDSEGWLLTAAIRQAEGR